MSDGDFLNLVEVSNSIELEGKLTVDEIEYIMFRLRRLNNYPSRNDDCCFTSLAESCGKREMKLLSFINENSFKKAAA